MGDDDQQDSGFSHGAAPIEATTDPMGVDVPAITEPIDPPAEHPHTDKIQRIQSYFEARLQEEEERIANRVVTTEDLDASTGGTVKTEGREAARAAVVASPPVAVDHPTVEVDRVALPKDIEEPMVKLPEGSPTAPTVRELDDEAQAVIDAIRAGSRTQAGNRRRGYVLVGSVLALGVLLIILVAARSGTTTNAPQSGGESAATDPPAAPADRPATASDEMRETPAPEPMPAVEPPPQPAPSPTPQPSIAPKNVEPKTPEMPATNVKPKPSPWDVFP